MELIRLMRRVRWPAGVPAAVARRAGASAWLVRLQRRRLAARAWRRR